MCKENEVVMDDIELEVNATKKHMALIEKIFKELMIEGVDYGEVPTSEGKQILLKPGAEKFCRYFKLGFNFEITKDYISAKDDLAMINYKCNIFSLETGAAIASCHGSCNNREAGQLKYSLFDSINVLHKMAQKRALVGAVLFAVQASHWFTQDLEDMPKGKQQPSTKTGPVASNKKNPGDYVIKIGPHRDMKIKDVAPKHLKEECLRVGSLVEKSEKGEPSRNQKRLLDNARNFLRQSGADSKKR